MRYAFISDLHSNLQAWRAVHLDIRSSRVDYIICLGDIVGYGPSPAELLNEVHSNVDAFVMGNHDAVVCGSMDDSSFTLEARELIRWTATRVNRKAAAFLRSFPLTLVGNGFRCAHGDFARPANFEYVLNPEQALPSWQAVDSQLLLTGHTHAPAFFIMGPSGIPRETVPQDFELEPEKRYFLNAGSVGYPRDGDPRASYCIYDTQAQAVFWRRVPFDLDSYRTTLIQCGLNPARSHLLAIDPRQNATPVRALLDFTPPATLDKAAKNAVATRPVAPRQTSGKTWKHLFIAALALLIATGLSLGLGMHQRQPSPAPGISFQETGIPPQTGKARKQKTTKTGSRKRKTPLPVLAQPTPDQPAPIPVPAGTIPGTGS